MLVMYVDDQIVGTLYDAKVEEVETHIKNGYKDLIGKTVKAVEIKNAKPEDIIIDNGLPRAMTAEEKTTASKARADERELEKAIVAELRAMAIERIEMKVKEVTK